MCTRASEQTSLSSLTLMFRYMVTRPRIMLNMPINEGKSKCSGRQELFNQPTYRWLTRTKAYSA